MVKEHVRVGRINGPKGDFHGWWVWCPGCKKAHIFDARWNFNGDMVKPTFRASMLVYEHKNEAGYHQPRCHSFVTDGQIQFLNDCTHELKGKTVDLPYLDNIGTIKEGEEP